MLDKLRNGAGVALILCSLGLSVISGFTSYSGMTSLLPGIPFIGFLGFVIAVSLVGLGVGVSSEIAGHKWRGAVALSALLILVGLADYRTNRISFESQVRAATQIMSDRNTNYNESVEVLSRTRTEIDTLTSNLELMQSNEIEDIKAGQMLLSGLGLYNGEIDGIRGGLTFTAMRSYGRELTKRLGTLRETEEATAAIVAKGVTVSEAPFGMEQAALYAVLLTAFSLVLSFAGGYLANSAKEDAEYVEELAETVDEMEDNLFNLVEFLESRQASA